MKVKLEEFMQHTKHSAWNIEKHSISSYYLYSILLETRPLREQEVSQGGEKEVKGGRAIADNILRCGVPSSIVKRREKEKNKASRVLQRLQRTNGYKRKRILLSRSVPDKNLLHRRIWTRLDACQPKREFSDKTWRAQLNQNVR